MRGRMVNFNLANIRWLELFSKKIFGGILSTNASLEFTVVEMHYYALLVPEIWVIIAVIFLRVFKF